MSRRRVSCPLTVQQLWDAVKIIRYKRQVPDVERITRYMNRVHNVSEGMFVALKTFIENLQISCICLKYMEIVKFIYFSDEVGRQINYCVRDGLLKVIKKIGSKGSKVGIEQEGYKLPDDKVRSEFYFQLKCADIKAMIEFITIFISLNFPICTYVPIS